jgi:hypothetical protein
VLEQPHFWALFQQRTVGGKIDPIVCQTVASITGVDSAKLAIAAERKLQGGVAARASGATGDEEDFRRSEYQAICDGKVGPQSELYVECAKLTDYEPEVSKFFSRIRLVHKLRETRALAGFTRILPPDGNLASDRLQGLKLDQQIDWLPAIKVYGEGIFLEVNADEIIKWAATVPGLRPEFVRLVARYNAARTARLQPNRNITAKFLLLHTLAHVLINQLSFDCGYMSVHLSDPACLFVTEIAVDKKLLMRFADTLARQCNCLWVRLNAIEEKISFYEGFDYQKIPGRKPIVLDHEKYFPMEHKVVYLPLKLAP